MFTNVMKYHKLKTVFVKVLNNSSLIETHDILNYSIIYLLSRIVDKFLYYCATRPSLTINYQYQLSHVSPCTAKDLRLDSLGRFKC